MRLAVLLGFLALFAFTSHLVYADAPSTAASAVPPETVSSQIVEGLQLTLSTNDYAQYPVGSPVYIDVLLKNTTDANRQLLYPNQVEDFLNILVLDDKGQPAPLTAYGRTVYLPPNFHSKPNLSKLFGPYNGIQRMDEHVFLAAHQQFHFHLLLNQIFDMSESHAYSVSVKLWVPRQGGKGVVTLASPSLNMSLSDNFSTISAPMQTNPGEYGDGIEGEPHFAIGQSF